jgi:amino acid transporter
VQYKLEFAVIVVLLMILLNMRGAKESVVPLVLIFLTFLITHVLIIPHAVVTHIPNLGGLVSSTKADVSSAVSEVGFWGFVFLLLKSYSMGAGTYTGIEAVSNGMPILREPKAATAKRTMLYMAVSLAFVAGGLMVAYLVYDVGVVPGKTLNAILFQKATREWPSSLSITFILAALAAEATLLFVAAQTGFLGGPRVLANMALDRWFPTKFSVLSDRLVT